jgi:hypothetical protein
MAGASTGTPHALASPLAPHTPERWRLLHFQPSQTRHTLKACDWYSRLTDRRTSKNTRRGDCGCCVLRYTDVRQERFLRLIGTPGTEAYHAAQERLDHQEVIGVKEGAPR